MKKNRKRKITAAILSAVLVFGFTTVAFARETVTYSGTCANNFYARKTLTKINDTHLQNHTINVAREGTNIGTLCNSKIYIAGKVVSARNALGPQSYHDFVDVAKVHTGTCKLQILNTDSNIKAGYKIKVSGEFTIGTSFIHQ